MANNPITAVREVLSYLAEAVQSTVSNLTGESDRLRQQIAQERQQLQPLIDDADGVEPILKAYEKPLMTYKIATSEFETLKNGPDLQGALAALGRLRLATQAVANLRPEHDRQQTAMIACSDWNNAHGGSLKSALETRDPLSLPQPVQDAFARVQTVHQQVEESLSKPDYIEAHGRQATLEKALADLQQASNKSFSEKLSQVPGAVVMPKSDVNLLEKPSDVQRVVADHQGIDKIGQSGVVAAVPNATAGINVSLRVKVPVSGGTDQTVGLFKPVGEEDAPKSAAALKKKGACQVREVATSAWNEICGIGDYPLTVPLKIQTVDGPQEGSVMAWRNGAKELGDVYVTESEMALQGSAPFIEAALQNPGVMDVEIKPKPGFKVSLDGRPPTKKLSDVKDEIDRKKVKSGPDKQFLKEYATYEKQLADSEAGLMETTLNGKVIKVSLTGADAPDGSPTKRLSDLVSKIEAKPEEAKRRIAAIDNDDAQELMALHVATLQLDARNAANVMFTEDDKGNMKPFAIDGGLSLPDKIHKTDAIDPVWAEEKWPQADIPWTPNQAKKFSKIDVKAKQKEFESYMSKNKMGNGLEPAAVNRMLAATQLMAVASAEGLTPRETWNILSVDLEGAVNKAEKVPPDAFIDEVTKEIRTACQKWKGMRKPV